MSLELTKKKKLYFISFLLLSFSFLSVDCIEFIRRIERSFQWKTIACSVMCCGCGSTPTSAANMEAGGCISEYQRDKDLARSQAIIPMDSSIALTLHRPLYPPGRIIHVVRHHPNKGE